MTDEEFDRRLASATDLGEAVSFKDLACEMGDERLQYFKGRADAAGYGYKIVPGMPVIIFYPPGSL